MVVRRWQLSRRIYVRPRTGPQSVHLWWPAVAKLQAASVPVAYAAASWDRHTYGQTDGRIALFQNVPLGRGHNNYPTRSARSAGEEGLCFAVVLKIYFSDFC